MITPWIDGYTQQAGDLLHTLSALAGLRIRQALEEIRALSLMNKIRLSPSKTQTVSTDTLKY